MQRAVPSPPTLPEITSTRFAGQRRYRDANITSSPTTTTADNIAPMIVVIGSPIVSSGFWVRTAELDTSIGNLVQQDGVPDDDNRIGAVHVNHEHRRSRRQRLLVGHSATLDKAVLYGHVNLPDTFAPTRNREVHGADVSHGRGERQRRVALEPTERLDDRGDTDHRGQASGQRDNWRDEWAERGRAESNEPEERDARRDRADAQEIQPFTGAITKMTVVRVPILEADEAGHELNHEHSAAEDGAPEEEGRHRRGGEGFDPRSYGAPRCASPPRKQIDASPLARRREVTWDRPRARHYARFLALGARCSVAHLSVSVDISEIRFDGTTSWSPTPAR